MHRSRLCHFVIDVSDLDRGVLFWSASLDAAEEPLPENSRHIYRRLRLPDSEIRILLQMASDEKVSKERMHLDLEADDVEAEVERLEALGATRWDHQTERGFDFWVLRDPWGNEFCVLQPEFPELLAQREPWNARIATLVIYDGCEARRVHPTAKYATEGRIRTMGKRYRSMRVRSTQCQGRSLSCSRSFRYPSRRRAILSSTLGT